jgi:hypothetical protein
MTQQIQAFQSSSRNNAPAMLGKLLPNEWRRLDYGNVIFDALL